MKRFILRCSLFLLPLVACIAIIEWKLAGMPNTYSQKRADFESQLNDVQILVLGPSNSLHGIDPASFSHKGYNLANASQTLFYDSALTMQYIARMPKLKLVIIPITYNSLYTDLSDSRESFRQYFYSKYWDVNTAATEGLDLRKYSNIALYTPQKAFEFATKGFQVDLTAGLSSNGYLRYDTVGNLKNISPLLGAKRVELYRRMMKEAHYNNNVRLLTQFVASLRQKNIQVCFITTPVFNTFSRFCEPHIIQNNLAVIKHICFVHGCGFEDYSKDTRFMLNDFYDNDHLNARGAVKFSHILNNEVVSKVNF